MTESRVKYSFVMPAYKAAFFKEAIDSILGQTYPDFELIIVDDCSPEYLDAIIGSYDDPRIKAFRNEKNIGGKDLVAQWNHCISYASGEYIILASDDDIYRPHFLDSINKLINDYPHHTVFRPLVSHIDSMGKELKYELPIGYQVIAVPEFVRFLCSGRIFSGVPQYVFKTDALRANGGFVNFPTAWYSDDATVMSIAGQGIVMCNECLFSMRFSGENISSKHNNFNLIKQKTDASIMFVKYADEMLRKSYASEIVDEILAHLIHRVKEVEAENIENTSVNVFVKSLLYIKQMRSSLFPLRWRLRRLLDYFVL